MKSIANNASKEAKSCYLRRYQNDHRICAAILAAPILRIVHAVRQLKLQEI